VTAGLWFDVLAPRVFATVAEFAELQPLIARTKKADAEPALIRRMSLFSARYDFESPSNLFRPDVMAIPLA
jgi:hypothetical protein